ncbi:hypothetical protein ABZ897_20010 [Nonomuraea sp. NPDC046802]|uniref:hypothetical protein n=1 Tax=Nonomuraea sp. NPDC046802 TaxID=3154919 RepID=UPI0033DC3553
MRGEQDLVRTLRTAAAQVEGLDLAGGVARRRRALRTRQRMRVALAAAAVVAIAGGTTVALSGGERRAQPAEIVTPEAPKITPVEQLWPRAVVKMPAKKWKPVTGLSPTQVLLAANSAFEKAGQLGVYDSARGTTRVLGDIPSPKKKYYPQEFAVSSRYIAWYGETPQDNDLWADFWIMPREGGTARRVTEVTADVDAIGLTDDSLVWSVRGGGVYRVPLTGGKPSRVPGSDGLHLTAWPWANGRVSEKPGANQNRVVNLETGRSVDVPLPAQIHMTQCHAEWCVGVGGGRMIVQRVDGTGRKTLPVMFRPDGARWLLGDRYAMFGVYDETRRGQPIAVVYDLATGVTAGLGEKSEPWVSGSVMMGASSSAPSTTPSWDADVTYHRECGKGRCVVKTHGGGKQFTVVNLLAATP